MIEPLIRIVERHGPIAAVIQIQDKGTYYSIVKTASRFGVQRRTIDRWLEEGKFSDTFVYPSGRTYISTTEIDTMLNQRVQPQTDDYKK